VRRLLAAAGLAALAAAVPARAADDALPASLLRAIAALAPTTLPVDRIDISSEDCALDAPTHPARVRGDFDGDGYQDWALHLRSAAPVGTRVSAGRTWALYAHRFVVFFGRPGGGFEAVTISLGEQPRPFTLMLEPRPPGPVKDVEGGEGRSVVLVHPGIVEVYCGRAASTYYWDARARKFEYLVTGD
jgi:hypothetical protein